MSHGHTTRLLWKKYSSAYSRKTIKWATERTSILLVLFCTFNQPKLRYVFLEQIAIQTRSISQRLAQRLLFILEGYGNHILIQDHHIQISQEQLANMLTTSRQTINHELSLLEKQNIIKIAFRKIEILDIEKLKVIAQVHS